MACSPASNPFSHCRCARSKGASSGVSQAAVAVRDEDAQHRFRHIARPLRATDKSGIAGKILVPGDPAGGRYDTRCRAPRRDRWPAHPRSAAWQHRKPSTSGFVPCPPSTRSRAAGVCRWRSDGCAVRWRLNRRGSRRALPCGVCVGRGGLALLFSLTFAVSRLNALMKRNARGSK